MERHKPVIADKDYEFFRELLSLQGHGRDKQLSPPAALEVFPLCL
jgi:hypothetical protein